MSSAGGSLILASDQILSALPRQHYPLLFSNLHPVTLARGHVLYDLGGPINSAFFIMSGMVSLLATTEDGSTTQVGMVGDEGVVGIPAVLKIRKAPYQVSVQIPGRAMRVKAEILVNEFAREGPLQEILLRYVHSLRARISHWLTWPRLPACRPSRLRHKFKLEVGVTPTVYLQKLRLERARQLLIHHELTVKEVKAAAGISSDSYFTHQFKRAFGVPPSRSRAY